MVFIINDWRCNSVESWMTIQVNGVSSTIKLPIYLSYWLHFHCHSALSPRLSPSYCCAQCWATKSKIPDMASGKFLVIYASHKCINMLHQTPSVSFLFLLRHDYLSVISDVTICPSSLQYACWSTIDYLSLLLHAWKGLQDSCSYLAIHCQIHRSAPSVVCQAYSHVGYIRSGSGECHSQCRILVWM